MIVNTPKNIINQTLAAVNSVAESSTETLRQFDSTVKQKLMSQTTKLGITQGEVQAGFKALNAAVDDIVESVPGSLPKQITDKVVIVEMTAELQGLQNKVVQSISSDAANLQAITGSTKITNGFRDAIVAAGTAEALAAAAKIAVPTAKISELKTIAENIVDISIPISLSENFGPAFGELEEIGGELNKLLDNVVKSGFGIGDALNKISLGTAASLGEALKNVTLPDLNIQSEFNKLKSEVFSNINSDTLRTLSVITNGFGNVIEDTIESAFGDAQSIVDSLAVVNGIQLTVSNAKRIEINQLISAGKLDVAAKVLSKQSDKSLAEIQDGLRRIDNRASVKTARPTAGVTVKATNLNQIAAKWQGKNSTNEYWSTVSIKSPAELESELSAINREVTEVIIFSTGNANNPFTGSKEFHQFMWDLGEFKDQEGFHYYIGSAGTLERGKPIDLKFSESAVEALPNGHHERSITLAFEGTRSAQATQDTQKRIKDFLNSIYKIYPGIQVVGWRDIAPDVASGNPYFDFIEFVEAKYGKKSLFTDPSEQPPFTRKQLAQGYTV